MRPWGSTQRRSPGELQPVIFHLMLHFSCEHGRFVYEGWLRIKPQRCVRRRGEWTKRKTGCCCLQKLYGGNNVIFFKNYVFVKQNPIDKEMNKSARTNAVHSRPSEDIVTVIKRPESALFLPPLGRVWLKYIYIFLWKNKICNVHTALGRLK